MTAQREMLGANQMHTWRQYHTKQFAPSPKLFTSFLPKKNYPIHYANLLQAVRHGLVIEKFHRGISFSQSAFMSEYIELNNELRRQAVDEFEKNLFKLLNNSVYGKTCENLKDRSDIELVFKRRRMRELLNRPGLMNVSLFGRKRAIVQSRKSR